MEAARCMRACAVEEIRPLLNQIDTNEFLSQTVPAYGATAIMNQLWEAYPDYSYKEAVLNSTNPEHKAASWEEDIIQYFRNYGDVKEYTDVTKIDKGSFTSAISQPPGRSFDDDLLKKSVKVTVLISGR